MISGRVRHRNLIKRFIRMFRCDTARIISFPERMFLVIGSNRNTKDGSGYWTKNGHPINFDYVEEKVIASGKTEAELVASAKRYRKLCGMTTEDYLRQLLAPLEAR